MSGFSDAQVKALRGKLKAAHVRTREEEGKELAYIEGWFAIAEANRIFGFDGWSRETVDARCVWEGDYGGRPSCSYIARVRIAVPTTEHTIIREGSGFGGGSGATPGEAHEMALKEAETDAMKRALVTFGNRFGLALYDPERRGMSRPRAVRKAAEAKRPPDPHWPVVLPGGPGATLCATPQAFYGELRKVLETLTSITEVQALWHLNEATLKTLTDSYPYLRDQKGAHYSAVFARLCKRRIKTLEGQGTADSLPCTTIKVEDTPNGRSIDKSLLAISAPKRIRDRSHLKHVAGQPCLVCGRTPAHAHHLTFAQPRARGLKSGDQWAVPLCALHHRELHDRGNERAYWKDKGMDPEQIAEALWQQHKGQPTAPIKS